MEAKAFTINDDGAEIRVLAVKLKYTDNQEGRLVWREGFGRDQEYIMLSRLGGDSVITYSPDRQTDPTMKAAHLMLLDYFDTIPTGGTINVKEYRKKLDE